VLNASCVACTSPYFFNGAFCITSALVSGYNIDNSSCGTGSTMQLNNGINIRCVCTLGSYYQDGITCKPCGSTSPGGLAICTTCSATSGYYASTAGCVYCPNLIGSTGGVDSFGCICHSSYYWNAATSTCDCNFPNNYVGGPIANCLYCPSLPDTV
jgi:hypothetical protein